MESGAGLLVERWYPYGEETISPNKTNAFAIRRVRPVRQFTSAA
jgi:hypothetical protein